MRKRTILAVALFALLPAAAFAQSFSAPLTPAPSGDTDGSGLAVVTISGTTVSYVIFAQNLATVTGASIQKTSDGSNAVTLNPSFTGGGATGSVSGVSQAVINDIIANPSTYRVNVTTNEFPNGAIRGALVGNGGGQETPSTCSPGDTTMCLNANRFRVEATWTTPNGQSGPGHAVKVKEDSGYFWFFNADNIEMVVKVLNACSIGSTQWVFAGGLTNVQVVLKVTDTKTGTFRTYTNPQGQPLQPIQDTSAFACP